jgi:hypothetical protein
MILRPIASVPRLNESLGRQLFVEQVSRHRLHRVIVTPFEYDAYVVTCVIIAQRNRLSARTTCIQLMNAKKHFFHVVFG